MTTAAEVWAEVSSALVTGLVHALNNRVACLDGIAVTLDDDGPPVESRLASEGERLRALAEIARHIAAEPGATAETTTVKDLLDAARALVSLHPEARDVRLEVRGAESVPAVRLRVRRAEHALVMAMLAAMAGSPGGLMAMCATNDERVEVTLRPVNGGNGESAPATTETLCAAADVLLHDDGGEVDFHTRAVRTITVRVPTLALARRR